MKPQFKLWVRIMAFAAAAAAILLITGLMRATGTLGLLAWNPSYRSIPAAIVVAGAAPLLFALVFGILSRWKAFRGVLALGWLSLCVSTLVAVLCLFGTAYLAFAPLAVDSLIPAPGLLDPSKGIPVRAASGDLPYLRLALSSDPHWGSAKSSSDERSRTLATINSGGYDAFFLLGDTAEMGFPGGDFQEAASDLKRLVPDVPIRPILGNHDALVGAAGRWRKYFFPKDFSSDSGSPFYFRVDAGKTHLIALELLWGDEEFDAAQREWLIRTLEEIPRSDAVIVLSHCFFYSSGYIDPGTGKAWYDHPDTIGEVSPILEKYGVDLVVSGHNHYMELLAHGGVTYAVIGALGGLPDPEPTYNSPALKWIRTSTFGFLEVDSYPECLELIFRDASGKELYRTTVPTDR